MASAIQGSRTRESSDLHYRIDPEVAPLLVATDASAPADAAVRAAQAIAAHTGQRVKVLAVHEPLPLVAAEVQIAASPDMEAESRASLREQVKDQLQRVGVDAPWSMEVATGDPAATIVTVARDIGASLVIMGLGGHGVFDRFLGDETVLKVLRLGTVPVLAVARDFSDLPTRVLAAMDFSASSVRALKLGAQLLKPRGRLTIAHVITPDRNPVKVTKQGVAYSGTVGRALDRAVAEVGFGDTAVVERKVLAGDPAKELLRLRDDVQPDLIVAGSHGHNFLTRLMLGSVSTRLVRRSSCSVLVAPPENGPDFIQELPKVTAVFGFYEWAERLEDFTRRNAGRRATLEVIDPDIGAQVQEHGVTFLGASFDPRDARVHIMFGTSEGGEKHLTRGISGVTAIQALHDRSCRDLLLRVAHGRGQTLVTLER